MADSLAHRGPDGEGYWINPSNTVGFGHRRLAIIDLSETGAQPMHYLNRYTIVYNGEIYNYPELKKELQIAGYTFHSKSDTEVILAAYDCYKEDCVTYFDGMFAFAIWDEKTKTLFAARDRFGEKPFYYYAEKNKFFFASEMKALWAAGIEKNVEHKMVLNYIALGYVQNPADKSQTFFKKISSLLPAHCMHLSLESGKFSIQNYWQIDKQSMQKISVANAAKRFNELFNSSIHRRLRSDVPVGTSLSGGLDSSSIAYYINRQLLEDNVPGNFKSFSAVFPGFEKDEAKYIRTVADQFRFQSFTVTPSADDLIKDFEKLCYHQEEPFSSSSVYAQYKVFELAKSHHVKVLLDGQGADEVLAGYHKYAHWYLQELVSRHRFSLAKKERDLLQKNNIRVRWDVKNVLAAFLPSHAAIALEKTEYQKIVNNNDVSRTLLSNLKGREWDGIRKPIVTKLNDILHFNTMENGLEELLRYADRNSMAHGTEVRLPFLHPDLVKFLFSLPSGYKIHNGYTKWILRKIMTDKIPESITWRTDKVGYEPPQKLWMENQRLSDYMNEAKKTLVAGDILKPQVLQKKIHPLDAHEGNNYDWRYLCAAHLLQK